MERSIRVEFHELAKSVTVETKLEYNFNDNDYQQGKVMSNTEVLEEAKDLFNQAQQHSKVKTLEKMQ